MVVLVFGGELRILTHFYGDRSRKTSVLPWLVQMRNGISDPSMEGMGCYARTGGTTKMKMVL